MAYRDYILCGECGCKLIYDGHDNGREQLEQYWGDPTADTWTVGLLCPDCLKKQQAEIAWLTAELAALQSTHEALCEAFDKAADGLAASQERERVLREAIEKAPHKEHCRAEWETEWDYAFRPFWVRRSIFEMRPDKCNCWKRAALGEP